MMATNTSQEGVCNAWSDLPPVCGNLASKLEAALTVMKCLRLPHQERDCMKRLLSAELKEMQQEISIATEFLEEIRKDLKKTKVSVSEMKVLHRNLETLTGLLPAAPEKKSVPALPVIASGKADIPTIAHLQQREWETVPRYIKLRITKNQVDEFIEFFNKQLTQKYTLLKKKRSTLNQSESTLWTYYRTLETAETKGHLYFLVANDLKPKSERTILSMTPILRHCRRLREMRTGKIVRYVVVKG